jgi:O-antigen/teichoic acid export membrane protein
MAHPSDQSRPTSSFRAEHDQPVGIRANVAANYFGQIYAAGTGFAFVPVFIRYLGTEAYGLIAVFAIVQTSATLLDMGMRPTLAREMARHGAGGRDAQFSRDLLRTAEILSSCVALVVTFAAWAASAWLAAHWLEANRLPQGTVAHALTGMGAICALRLVENVYVGSIVGLQRQVTQCIISCSLMTARAVGGVVVLALVAPDIETFFRWQVLVSLVAIPAYGLVVYRSLSPAPRAAGFSWSLVAELWKFSGGVTANSLLTLLLTQLDKILLSARIPLQQFSYYAVASTLNSALYMLAIPISAAFYPSFAEHSTRNDVDGLRLKYHQAAKLMATIMGSAAMVLGIFAATALQTWTGDGDVTAHATPFLRVLALGTLLNGFVGVPYQLQLATGWTSLTVRVNVAAVSVLAPALFLVIPRYGAIGAAWIWVALNLGYLIFYIHFMHRRLLPTEKWRWYGQDVLLPAAAGALAAVVCRACLPEPSSKIGGVCFLTLVFLVVALSSALSCQSKPQLHRHDAH